MHLNHAVAQQRWYQVLTKLNVARHWCATSYWFYTKNKRQVWIIYHLFSKADMRVKAISEPDTGRLELIKMASSWREISSMHNFFFHKETGLHAKGKEITYYLFLPSHRPASQGISVYNEVWFSFSSGDKMKALQLEQHEDILSSTKSPTSSNLLP